MKTPEQKKLIDFTMMLGESWNSQAEILVGLIGPISEASFPRVEEISSKIVEAHRSLLEARAAIIRAGALMVSEQAA